MDFIYAGELLGLFIVSVVLGEIFAPIIVRALEFFTKKDENALDNRIIRAIKMPLESFFFLFVFYFLIHSFSAFSLAAKFLETYTYAIIIVLLTFMFSEAAGALIYWYQEEGYKTARHMKMDLSLLPLLSKVTKIVIYVIGLTIALSVAGFDVTGLLAVTSVVGIIAGLASQETLGNVFAGIALQLDRSFNYGDYLFLPGGDIAIIRKVGMRSTRLEDMSHNTIIMSNSEFAKLRVTNLSLPDELSVVAVRAELPLEADLVSLKQKIVSELGRAKPAGLLPDKGYALSVDAVKVGSAAVTFSFWVKGYENTQHIKDIATDAIYRFAKLATKKKR